MKRLLVILLLTFLTKFAGAQTMVLLSTLADGTPTTCLDEAADIDWTIKNERTGKTATPGSTSDWYEWGDGCHFTINLQELEAEGAFRAGDVFTVSVNVLPAAGCLSGYSGTQTYVFDGGGFLQTEGDPDGFLFIDLAGVKPTIAVADASLCEGETGKSVSIAFTNAPADIATGGYTIDWGIAGISTSGALAASGATGSIDATVLTATASGKAKLKKADGTVVAESGTYTVTVNAKPAITVSPDPAAVCSGTGTTLTASGADTYVWKNGSSSVGSSAALNTGNLTANTTYTVVGTSAEGCPSDEKTVTVTVKEIPTATLAVKDGKDEICADPAETITLEAGPTGSGYTYAWTGVSSSSATATASPTATTTYGVVVTKDGCSSEKAEKTVTVNTVTVGVTAVPASVAYNGTTVVTATPAGAANYNWTKGDIAGATSGASLSSVTSNKLTANTDFEVEVTDNKGCKGKGMVTVSVTGTALVVNPTGAGTFCSSELPAELNAGDTGGTGTPAYTWTSSPAGLVLSGTNVRQPQILATSTPGSYSVTVEVVKGTETITSAPMTVVVKETPALGTPSVTPATMTAGNSAALAVTATPAAATITWTGGNFTAPQMGASVTTGVISAPGTYTYTVEADLDGCKSETKDVTLTVQEAGQPLAVNPTGAGTFCSSELPADLNAGDTGGTGTPAYTWTSTPAGLVLSGTNVRQPQILATSTPGTYSVTVEVVKGTETITSTPMTVIVKETPVLGTPSVTPNSMTAGNSAALAVTATPAAATITWTGGNFTAPQTGASVTTGVISAPGTYTYTVEADLDGCKSETKDVTLTVEDDEPGQPLAVNPTGAGTFCSSELPAGLNAGDTGGTGTPVYTWTSSPAGLVLSGTNVRQPQILATSMPGTYSVTVTVVKGTDTETSAPMTVVVKKTPVLGTLAASPASVSQGASSLLTLSSVEPASAMLTWSSTNGGPLAATTGTSVSTGTINTIGTYTYKVTADNDGCMAEKTVNVTVTGGGEIPGSATLAMTVDKKCAYEGEKLKITITGSGADSYSFVLRDQANNPVMTVTDQTVWEPYMVSTYAAGIYKITDFTYKLGGVQYTGTTYPSVTAIFDAVPNVYATADHRTELNHCAGDLLTLKGSGDTGVSYSWDHGVQDGVPFEPVTAGTYTVTATNLATGCRNTSSVNIRINPKPQLNPLQPQEVCEGELVTLTATGSGADRFDWNNGVVNGQPFRAYMTTNYTVTSVNTLTGCSATAQTTVTVNQKPHIVRTSKSPRNIAIDKDAYFAVTAEGKNLTYTWKKKENGVWVVMSDNAGSLPAIVGSRTDSLSLLGVPQRWDGSEFRCVVSGDCGKDSADFFLNVRECFTITTELVMYEGIIPDEEPGNKIDGWYCRGQRIALKAIITSEEGYEIANAHYKWTIDGLDVPEEHVELESDTAVLTWIPQFTEDDIVVTVCAYCDGACEEVCPRYIRLKAREFEDVAMRIQTDRDPSHRFCAGDTVNFWLVTKNAGVKPVYTWYNDVFQLPEELSPKNELLHHENDRITLVMGQEDTWVRVEMTPSTEMCVREPLLIDTVFMRKKPWVEPMLHIDCADTLVCKGDSVSMRAVYANAGENPAFQWQRSIGDPFPDWNLGNKEYATVYVDEEDVWVKCTMVPSEDVCYSATGTLVDAVKIVVLKDNANVTIACDMEDKQVGEELVFEATVENVLGTPRYEWYADEMKAPVEEEEYITASLREGSVVYCMVSGDRLCQKRMKSNEIVVHYGQFNRDTMLVLYKNETVRNLNMAKEGDNLATLLFRIETPANNGMASISPDGKFTYLPNTGFIGTDFVKYAIINRSDKSVYAEGYIYITVKENNRFFVPNLITPNEDGLNDSWKLDFISDYPDHLIQIFNRDGMLVYEARNYQNDWKGEGMAKGGYVGHINLVNGIYTYIIDLGDKDKTILKSWLEIRANLNRRNYR